MGSLVDTLADEDSLINSLPDTPVSDLSPGDTVMVVYDPSGGSDAQVVHGCVTGVDADTVAAVAPRSGGDRDHDRRRVFTIHRESKALRARWFGRRPYHRGGGAAGGPWREGDAGHLPVDDGQSPWGLGEVIRVVPADVDMGAHTTHSEWCGQHPSGYGATTPRRLGGRHHSRRGATGSGGNTCALFYRLFERAGGSDPEPFDGFDLDGLATPARDRRVRHGLRGTFGDGFPYERFTDGE